MYEAAYAKANVKHGKKNVFNQPSGSVNGFAQLPKSSGFTRPNLITTKSKIKIPEINVGKDVPSNTNTVLARSTNLPLNLAASTPSEIPIDNHIMKAPIARLSVIGNASAIILVTHSWRLNE